MATFVEIIKAETNLKKWRSVVLQLSLPENRGSRKLLLQLLFSKDTVQCLKAIAAVKLGGIREAVEALCWLLIMHKDYRVRMEAARALGVVGGYTRNGRGKRFYLAPGMESIGAPPSFGALNYALTAQTIRLGGIYTTLGALNAGLLDPVVEVGIEASQAIAKIDGYFAMMLLLGAARHNNEVISAHGTYGLSKIRDKKCAGRLLMLLEDKCSEIRAAAAEALGCMGLKNKYVPDAIRQAMLEENSAYAQIAMAKVLLNMGEDVLWTVLPRLKSTNPAIRQVAAAIAACGLDKEAVRPLMELLFDADVDVRRSARDALLRFKKAGLVDELPRYEHFAAREGKLTDLFFSDGHLTAGQIDQMEGL